MSKCELEAFPNSNNRFEIFINSEKLTWQEIMTRKKCKAIINLGYFTLKTFIPCSGLVVNQSVIADPIYHAYGICINKNGDLSYGTEDSDDAKINYRVAVPCLWLNGEKFANEFFEKNGTTMIGFRQDGTPVLFMCSKDEGMTSTEARDMLICAGCNTILRFDGSWSTQGSLGEGRDVQASERRIVYDYLLVYDREEIMPKVVLDPGHSIETPGKCSPDNTYYEHEFALDMAYRMKKILEENGVEVTLTRTTEHALTKGYSLAEGNARVKIANDIKDLNLYVSLHSNAENTWGTAKGWSIMTSAKDKIAERNKAAEAIVARVKEAGITLRPYPFTYNASILVLRKTVAPAVLIEHGFHTNKKEVELLKNPDYRQRLATAECKGILDYLGLSYKENYYEVVKNRFSLSDATMQYMLNYQYSTDLLKKLATSD